jgi:hypothetical protein
MNGALMSTRPINVARSWMLVLVIDWSIIVFVRHSDLSRQETLFQTRSSRIHKPNPSAPALFKV